VESIITTDIIRYDHPGAQSGKIRSHILHPHTDITLICILETPKANVMSVIEDHLLESIGATEWKHGEEDADFSYVTEKYNHFLNNLAVEDMREVGIVFAVERDGHLMVSSIGDSEVILQEKYGNPMNIHEDTTGHHHFELISSGDIPLGSSVFIVSRNLEKLIGDTFYTDCAMIESARFVDIAREVLARDVWDSVHLIRIRHTPVVTEEKEKNIRESLRRSTEFEAISERVSSTLGKALAHPRWRDAKEDIQIFLEERHSTLLSGFLLVGVVIFFLLVSYLISALFGAGNSWSVDAKNQIIEAKTLIESSQKLTANPIAFDTTISQAETILKDLESKQLYIKDVTDLRDRIEAMKKEIYDIQTVKLSGKASIVPFKSEELSPVGIYEKDKKISLIARQGMIQDYAVGDTGLQMKQYPSWEWVKDYAVQDDGSFYLLTDSNKILSARKNADISYANVTGQDGWEVSDGIATFNGNIYLWNKAEGKIYKHRPGINGFGAKAEVIPDALPGIIDVGIDGGFYVLRDDKKISRIVSSSITGMTLNQVPGAYTIGTDPSQTRIILWSALNYVYILDRAKVWIFSPDAKRFQDITSWTYISQIELSSEEKVIDIAVPRDGLIYVLTDKWVYSVWFELVDNNIIIQ
jgi:hypothetical protein